VSVGKFSAVLPDYQTYLGWSSGQKYRIDRWNLRPKYLRQ